MVPRYLEEHLRTNCVPKISLRPFNITNTRNLLKNGPKMTISNFCCIGPNLETKTIVN